jgi:hypothetical protein
MLSKGVNSMETANFKQVYFTTNIPDDNGNYYYPVFIPDNVLVQYPLTDVAIDPSLGGHGLKFDWTTNQWIVSSQDPTLLELKKLQEQAVQQQTINLSLMSSAFAKASSALPNNPTASSDVAPNVESTAVSAPNLASTVADSAVTSAVSDTSNVASSASADPASTATDATSAH